MEQMIEQFIPRLNAFTDLMKEARKFHVEYIVQLGQRQKELSDEVKSISANLKIDKQNVMLIADKPFRERREQFLLQCLEFEKSAKTFGAVFQQHIDDTNFQLGMISNMWGGYIENIAIQYMLNCLKKDYGAHTSFQKFKRHWDKKGNLEIDLLALSDTHAYVVEVKNQMKEDSFLQMLTTLEKMKSKMPEYKHLKRQPILMCMHSDERLIHTAVMGSVWILRYKGFDRDKPENSFEWLRKD